MRELVYSTRFMRDLKRMLKQGKDETKLTQILDKLANNISLDPKHKDHPLTGNYTGYRDCHIEPDWLLIYNTTAETVFLHRTGTHNDLF